jgi:hypothetical protein
MVKYVPLIKWFEQTLGFFKCYTSLILHFSILTVLSFAKTELLGIFLLLRIVIHFRNYIARLYQTDYNFFP